MTLEGEGRTYTTSDKSVLNSQSALTAATRRPHSYVGTMESWALRSIGSLATAERCGQA